jgi:two-component system, OmpR family, copper resistance phosphate regulon response regulator CusR
VVKILIVEDDSRIAAVVRRGLEGARYTVDLAADCESGLSAAVDGFYDLIILDLMLPGGDGWEICRRLRERRIVTPILILSARDSVDERIRGLEIGADDYLPKPFNFAELLARVQALLRRDHVHKTRVIRIADLEIDTTSGRVSRGGSPVELTSAEYSVLEALASDEGRTLSREALRQRVPFEDVEAHLDSLRHKVDEGRQPRLIHSLPGEGYTLRGPELVPAA